MRRLLPALLILFALSADAGERYRADFYGTVVINGTEHRVYWDDGDSFSFQDGPRKGKETRLVGFNTLESYGPVHRWGEWTAEELWGVAKLAPKYAASRTWQCKASGKRDAYNRLLVDCPTLRRAMVRNGLAHLFAYDDPATEEDLAAQVSARIDELGMWAKGRPETIITSVHPAGENASGRMRIVHVRSGETEMAGHRKQIDLCSEFCFGDPYTGSCMVYVPYKLRYRDDKPACLQGEPPEIPLPQEPSP